jgi:WD40 repeat protein
MVMKRHSYKKNYNIKNTRKSKINGGRPPVEDNDQCRVIATLGGLERPDGHRAPVTSVAFHPKLPLLATGSNDKTAKLWSFDPNGSEATNMLATLKYTECGRVISVAFHPMLPLLAISYSDEYTAKLWRFDPHGLAKDNMSAFCVATLDEKNGHNGIVNSVDFHPRLPLLATGSRDYTAKIWSFDPDALAEDNMLATCVATLEGEEKEGWGSVRSVAFHPTLPFLATGSNDGTAKLWRFSPDGSTATCEATLDEPIDGIMSMAFHSTLPLLATSSGDYTAKLWSYNPDGSDQDNMSAKCVAILRGHSSYVISVAFHPTLPLLATGSWDNTAKIWSFDPDALAEDNISATYDHATHNWSLAKDNISATCEATLGGPRGHSYHVVSVAFHPNATSLATGSLDNTAKLWHCKILESYNDFILFPKKTGLDRTVCSELCYFCNFNLCMKNPSNDNNSNGYVVKLTNGDIPNDIYVHYNCLHYQLINNKTEIDNRPISTDTIHKILNIDRKMDALIGTDFYNDSYTDGEGDTFYSANSNRNTLDNEDVFYSAKSYSD